MAVINGRAERSGSTREEKEPKSHVEKPARRLASDAGNGLAHKDVEVLCHGVVGVPRDARAVLLEKLVQEARQELGRDGVLVRLGLLGLVVLDLLDVGLGLGRVVVRGEGVVLRRGFLAGGCFGG